MKILIVDDEEMIRNVLREYVEFEGNEADEAADGMEAVKKCRENDYDLILMDVMMPVMDGIAVTKAIRSFDHPLAKTIPIVAMTANAFEDDVRKMREAGMNEHLSKPIRITEVLKTIRRVLKTSGANNP